MNSVVIAAAGSGKRFGTDIPKQFHTIGGKPILVHTLEKFESCVAVDEIVVVASNDRLEFTEQLVSDAGFSKVIKIVAGGDTRTRSVANGFAAVSPEAEIVAVHDAARPFVTPEEIAAVIEKAAETGAACLVGAVVDTIKEVSDGTIVRTIDRVKLRRALTPQAFRYSVLEKALADAAGDATDEAMLVEMLGVAVACVEGGGRNIKITTPDDILIAEAFLRGGSEK
jgi:2-C-methyl-D-erythritol 4-phosphate cytidylyltransferase